jgi:3-phosphoglycerate kinase
MENLNELIKKIQEEQGKEVTNAEERTAKLAEIDNNIKALSKVLHALFEQKAALEAEEEQYQQEEELLQQRYAELIDIYTSKK